MRSCLPAQIVASACVLLWTVAGCYPKPKQAAAHASPAGDLDDTFAQLHESELAASLPALTCPEDGPPPPDEGLSMREAADALPHGTAKTQLAFAKAAARCKDVEAAAIVYRLVPALLLKRLEPKEIELAYGFLRDDRAHSLQLFRTLLTADRDGVGLRGPVLSELDAFRPEHVLAATCSELAGITPRFASQLELANRVLSRSACPNERVDLLRRSLESTSSVRAAACSRVEREKMSDLADAVVSAAETDPGEVVPSGHDPFPGAPAGGSPDGVVAAIFSGLLSPSTSVGNEPPEPGVRTYPGRTICEIAAKNLAKTK